MAARLEEIHIQVLRLEDIAASLCSLGERSCLVISQEAPLLPSIWPDESVTKVAIIARRVIIFEGRMHWLIKFHTQKWHCWNYVKKVLMCLRRSLQNTLRGVVAAYSTAVGHCLLIMYSWC